MSRLMLVSLAAATVALAGIATSKESAPQAMPKAGALTISGTLIDTKCYSMNARNQGNDHITEMGEMKGCGTLCAKLGIPVGVLTVKNGVWILVTPSQDLAEHIGAQARVTGAAVYGGHSIRPDKIEVKDASGNWTAITITTPMPMK